MSVKQVKVKSYKEYMIIQDYDTENDWGWFIDIEEDTDKKTQPKKIINIPPTIYEETPTKINKNDSKTLWSAEATCIMSIIYTFIILLV